jgi:hypothetical protein
VFGSGRLRCRSGRWRSWDRVAARRLREPALPRSSRELATESKPAPPPSRELGVDPALGVDPDAAVNFSAAAKGIKWKVVNEAVSEGWRVVVTLMGKQSSSRRIVL